MVAVADSPVGRKLLAWLWAAVENKAVNTFSAGAALITAILVLPRLPTLPTVVYAATQLRSAGQPIGLSHLLYALVLIAVLAGTFTYTLLVRTTRIGERLARIVFPFIRAPAAMVCLLLMFLRFLVTPLAPVSVRRRRAGRRRARVPARGKVDPPKVGERLNPAVLGVHPTQGSPMRRMTTWWAARGVARRAGHAVRRGGLVIVTGPPGSGKTRAALRAVVRAAPERRLHILTAPAALRDTVSHMRSDLDDAVLWLDRLEYHRTGTGVETDCVDWLRRTFAGRNVTLVATLNSGGDVDVDVDTARLLSHAHVERMPSRSVGRTARSRVPRRPYPKEGHGEGHPGWDALIARMESIRGVRSCPAFDLVTTVSFVAVNARRWGYCGPLNSGVVWRLVWDSPWRMDVDRALYTASRRRWGAPAALVAMGDGTYGVPDSLLRRVEASFPLEGIPRFMWERVGDLDLNESERATYSALVRGLGVEDEGADEGPDGRGLTLAGSERIGLARFDVGDFDGALPYLDHAAGSGSREVRYRRALIAEVRGETMTALKDHIRLARVGDVRAFLRVIGLVQQLPSSLQRPFLDELKAIMRRGRVSREPSAEAEAEALLQQFD